MDSTHFPVCNHIERAKPKQKWYETDCYTCKCKIVHNCRVRWIKSIKTYINNKNKSLNNLRHPTPHSRQQHGTLTCTSLLQCCSAADTHVPPPSCPQVTLELRCYLTSCCRSVRCGVERKREGWCEAKCQACLPTVQNVPQPRFVPETPSAIHRDRSVVQPSPTSFAKFV